MNLDKASRAAGLPSLVLFACCVHLVGCGHATDSEPDGAISHSGLQAAPFEGHWRKYDDPLVRFVKFDGAKIVIGDKHASQTGTFTYASASEVEPLYKIAAEMPDRKREFQLYFEEDTVDLIFDDENQSGLYEITFNAP